MNPVRGLVKVYLYTEILLSDIVAYCPGNIPKKYESVTLLA